MLSFTVGDVLYGGVPVLIPVATQPQHGSALFAEIFRNFSFKCVQDPSTLNG